MGQCGRLKSKLLELLKLDPVSEKPRDHVSLVDMGLIWRLATPTPEDGESQKRDSSEYHWGDYLDKICAMIFSLHANAYLIILVNDILDLPFSIKDDEHDRQAAKHPKGPNLKTGSQVPLSSTNSWLIPETRSDYRNL